MTYDGNTYSWEGGRQLSGISGNGKNTSYKYNDSGIRTQKTVNGVTTNYQLSGDKVLLETNPTDKIHYTYDSTGNLASMNLNSVEYYYIRNSQGDITGLLDAAGTQVVKYTYNSYGKLLSIDGTLKDTVGVKNPYRYRGYRYDTETDLYYLNSRYYNAEWGRFINSDGIVGGTGDLLGHNMFAYCKNNPINYSDPTGFYRNRVMDDAGHYSYGFDDDYKVYVDSSSVALSSYSPAVSNEFNYGASGFKNTAAALGDLSGKTIANNKMKETRVWNDIGNLTLGKYVSNLSKPAKFGKKALGIVGTIGATLWDVGSSISKGEYVGAGIDILAGVAGFGFGVLIGIGTAAAITAGMPALIAGGIGFGISVVGGMAIDYGANVKKDEHYGR